MDEFDTHIYDYIENSLKIPPGYAMLRNFDKQIWKHSIYKYDLGPIILLKIKVFTLVALKFIYNLLVDPGERCGPWVDCSTDNKSDS